MLKTPRAEFVPLRARSLRQEYEEFVLQRIEDYKEQLTRRQLLGLGDEAVQELDSGSAEQLVLTEVLMLDHVDRLIKRRLKLPPFRRWRDKHLRMRRAQQEPTHWGLPRTTPFADLARRVEEHEIALIVGARLATTGFLMAGHGANVLLIDQDLNAIDAAETRAASEVLTRRFQALVINLGGWLPDVSPTVVVIDADLMATLLPDTAGGLAAELKIRTVPSGVHVVVSSPIDGTAEAIVAGWEDVYPDWTAQPVQRADGMAWLVATKPGVTS